MDAAVLQSFLDDVKDDPFDPTRRLMFADWLEEHADSEALRARARLLRLIAQQEAGWPAAHLDPSEERAWGTLHRQADAARPFAHLGGLQACVGEGGLTHVSGTAGPLLTRALAATAATPAWAWVDGLGLEGSDARLARVFRKPMLAGVARLTLMPFAETPPLFDALFGALLASPHLGRLRILELFSGPLTPEQTRRLAGWEALPRLRALSLAVGPAGQLAAAADLPLARLHRLTLAGHAPDVPGLQALLRSPHLGGVKDLRLHNAHRFAGAALAGLRGGPLAESLERLDFSRQGAGDDAATALAAADLPALRGLDLSYNSLGAAGAEALARAPWPGRLDLLDLNWNPLGQGAAALAAAPLGSLRVLHLQNCGVGPEALEALLRSPHLGRLERLDLQRNPLGPRGGEILAACEGLPALRDLDLMDASLGAAGARALARWPGLARLRRLTLWWHDIGEKGFRAVVASPHRDPAMRLSMAGSAPSLELAELATRLYNREGI